MGKNNFVSITLSNLHSSVTTLYSMLAIQFINNNNNDNKINNNNKIKQIFTRFYLQ